MEDREPGFILYHRRLYSSPVWRSLNKGQRWVLLSTLVLANFRRKPLGYFGGELIYVERGELAHEVEKIAAHAEESYATARKAVEKMIAFGFIEVRWSFGAHNRVRILRVVNYERYQGVAQQARNEPNDGLTTAAQQPHNERTREQGEQEKRAPASASRERKTGLVSAAEQMTRPFAVQLHSLLAETWPDIGYAAGEPAVALDRACQEHGGTAAFAVACREFAQRKGVEPGSTKWFAACLKDIGRPKAEQPRGRKAMGVVGSNWEEPGF
jgi:hypothetical protein